MLQGQRLLIYERLDRREQACRQSVSTRAWTAAVKRAGMEEFHWRDLRHTFATWHRQVGMPTFELQRLGGWETGDGRAERARRA